MLYDLFGEIVISQAVYDESVVAGRDEGGARREVSDAAWIRTVEIQDRLAVEVLLDELDLGEAETIVLARQLGADWVLMDERKGRRKLGQLGVRKIGTIGILLAAKNRGLITAVAPDIERLRQHGFTISQAVVDAILEEAKEGK